MSRLFASGWFAALALLVGASAVGEEMGAPREAPASSPHEEREGAAATALVDERSPPRRAARRLGGHVLCAERFVQYDDPAPGAESPAAPAVPAVEAVGARCESPVPETRVPGGWCRITPFDAWEAGCVRGFPADFELAGTPELRGAHSGCLPALASPPRPAAAVVAPPAASPRRDYSWRWCSRP
jgi:hypothetical protein